MSVTKAFVVNARSDRAQNKDSRCKANVTDDRW